MEKQNDSEILARIRERKQMGEDNIQAEKDAIEADIALIRGKKKKGKENLIGDFTMSTKVRNMVARSYTNKSPVYIRSTQNGNERIAKAQNKVYQEDRDTPAMKATRYYKDTDKYTTGLAILAKTGWDGKKKCPIWSRINPLLAVPDPYGDYFAWDYRYIGFYGIKSLEEMEELGWDTTVSQDAVEGAKEAKREEQQNNGLIQQHDKNIFDVFYYFEEDVSVEIGEIGRWVMYAINGNTTHIHETKKLKTSPFSFFYWNPNGSFYGDRPANYCRDTQKWNAEMVNLQADKVRQEVYGTYLYNSDYVSGKDIDFTVKKKIPIKTGLDGAQVSLSNIVSKVPVDTSVSASTEFMNKLNRDVDNALSTNAIAEWSTPDRRETAKTNSMIMDSADVIFSLNEEMDAIGEQQFANIHFETYADKFTEADKKIIYAGSSTGESARVITRKDFIIDGNLSLQIETSSAREKRLAKETAWRTQNSPLILQDPEINQSSKRIIMRKLLLAWGADMEDVEEEVPMTAQYLQQQTENELLKKWIYIDTNPEDNDDEHLISMWDVDPENIAMVAHQQNHIANKISKSQQQAQPEKNQMLNGAMSQAMSQAGAQTAKLNSNQ